MKRMYPQELGSACATEASAAGGAHKPLIGTWKVVSALIRTVGVEGEQEQKKVGYLVFTPEHRIVAVVGDPDRKPATNDADALKLARSLVTYTGKVDIQPDRYVIDLEFSSSQLLLDQKQTRFYAIDGDTLTITAPTSPSTTTPGLLTSTHLVAIRER